MNLNPICIHTCTNRFIRRLLAIWEHQEKPISLQLVLVHFDVKVCCIMKGKHFISFETFLKTFLQQILHRPQKSKEIRTTWIAYVIRSLWVTRKLSHLLHWNEVKILLTIKSYQINYCRKSKATQGSFTLKTIKYVPEVLTYKLTYGTYSSTCNGKM